MFNRLLHRAHLKLPSPIHIPIHHHHYHTTTMSSPPHQNGHANQYAKSIGTHSGTFHADESLACYMLTHHTHQFANYPIVRTRDPAIWAQLPALVDVGAVYDVSKHRYDHHQREFTDTFDDKHKIRLSSAGLIYKHFGREIIAHIVHTDRQQRNNTDKLTDDETEIIYQKTYDNFIQALDGIDNGVSQYPADIQPAYKSSTDLSSRVAQLNPAWNEPSTDELLYAQFLKAMQLAGSDLRTSVLYTANSWLPARSVVMRAFSTRSTIHPSGQILLLDQYTVWKQHVFDIEQEQDCVGQIKLIVYGDSAGSHRVQSMPVSDTGFDNRLSLPEPWRGIRDQKLTELTGIDGCIFVHATGFIAGNATKEGALQMAVKTIEQAGSTINGDKKPRIQ